MWIDASAESEAAGGEAATGMASKRTKLPDTNKRKQPDEASVSWEAFGGA
jgi:hypothetical protein